MAQSRYIAEVRLTHPEMVLNPTVAAVPGVSAVLDYQTVVGETYYLFFEVSGGDFAAFDAAVAEDPSVSDPTVVVDGGDFRVYRMRLTSRERLVLPQAASFGLRVLRAESAPGGWLAKLEAPDVDRLRQFREHCAGADVGFALERLFSTDGQAGAEFGLTPRQRETLVAAYEAGYFDQPRAASLADLADRLDVSPSAVSGRLRRAIRSLVGSTVVE